MAESGRSASVRFTVPPFVVACLLLIVMVLEVALSTRRQSPSWDEGDHIYAGYMNWKHDEYDLNPEHPPLVKLVATLPLLRLHLEPPPHRYFYFKMEAYFGGHALLFRNGPAEGGHYSADALLFRTHMAALTFGLTLAMLLFVAGREMFGASAGLIGMALFVFDPTVLTNAPFVTTDMGGACGFFATVYLFYRFVKKPSFGRALACGLVMGLALGTKHSMLILPPLLAGLAVGEWLLRTRFKRFPGKSELRAGMKVLAIFGVAIVVLWGIYSFRYTMRAPDVVMPTFAEEISTLSPFAQKLFTLTARFHLLPESYLFGLADVQKVGLTAPTYIFGKIYAHGRWFYFPALLSLKWSAGTLGLLGLAVYAIVSRRVRQVRQARELWYFGGAAFVYLVLAMCSPLNIGVRHVLPLFPLTFLLIGAGVAPLLARRRLWLPPVAGLLLWHVVDSVRMFPNYMPYANIFWGGPSKTHLYFSDSAVEWGQELKFVKQWTDAHHVTSCWFAYNPAPLLLPSDYGVPCKLLPTLNTQYNPEITVPAVVHGPLLFSFTDLHGTPFGTEVRNPYRQLFQRTPDDVIANGIAVFYGDYQLPEAAAIPLIQRSRDLLPDKPDQAVQMARRALALAPDSFDANIALGDALLAAGGNGGAADALRAYQNAAVQVKQMEPTAKITWQPIVVAKVRAAVSALHRNHTPAT